MKFWILIPILAIALFSGSTGMAQNITDPFLKTSKTAWAINSDSLWQHLGNFDNKLDIFMGIQDLNFKDTIQKIWIRHYDYGKNILDQRLLYIDMRNKMKMEVNIIEYDLKSGLMFPDEIKDDLKFSPISPDSLGSSIYNILKYAKANEEEDNKVGNGKKNKRKP